MTRHSDADKYRLAQAHKMIRLGLIRKDEHGNYVRGPAMDEMDPGPIPPDDIDFAAIAQQDRNS